MSTQHDAAAIARGLQATAAGEVAEPTVADYAAEADANALSSMALIPLLGILVALTLGGLGFVVLGAAWLTTRAPLTGWEALGCLGVLGLGWAGADRLGRRNP